MTDLLSAVATSVLVFVAVPAVLVVSVAFVSPTRWTRADVVSARGLFDLFALVAAMAWIACCLPLVRAVVVRVRQRDAVPGAGAKLGERLAARIAAGVIVLLPAGPLLAGAAGAEPLGASGVPAVVAPAPAPTVAPATIVAAAPAGAIATCTVSPGDSLWSIAERYYGDGGEWQAVAAANLGHLMPGGQRFVDPSLIRPGWVLVLPGLPATPAPAVDAVDAAAPDGPPRSSNARTPAPPRDRSSAHHAPGRSGTHRRPGGRPAPRRAPLPELSALGLGVLVAAALTRRLGRARLGAGRAPGDGGDEAVEVATLLEPFAGSPLLDLAELANRALAAALERNRSGGRAPSVRAVCVGHDGVVVHLADDVGWAPAPFVADGATWRLAAAVGPDELRALAGDRPPWMAAIVPVGDDDAGTWLVPLPPGACLPVLGAGADAVVAAAQVAVTSWAWGHRVLVTTDPALVPGLDLNGRAPLATVFVGDPALLAPGARERCAVITTLPLPPTDLTIAVDPAAATIHPLGVTVRPNRLEPARRAALDELLAPAPPAATGPPPSGHHPARRDHHPHGRAEHPGVGTGSDLGPGPVEVRLLTAVPSIEGLAEPLDPKRARRATEVVAYLALHRPDQVTSERLRTRVLGSADADAAAKTLFNTAGAARRALGEDADGQPYLPPASRSGHYRISPLVTVDALRAVALATAAEEAADGDTAMALARAALELVDGEPLGGLLSGYGWWRAEGHEGRVAAALVEAAAFLATRAAEGGLHRLARWAVERARLVDPYSETLSQAAMEAAARCGDADQLRREWLECRRRVDELDPGGVPSVTTERLYDSLRRADRVTSAPDPPA
ncbi:MAG TPA: LysM peptidoglycan-binding domain-containing protein [Acidimicrobiales bacterium]|nr:LysM peptidoglycan-binding domain-containing protein [Acidimicrobiales bacterium]